MLPQKSRSVVWEDVQDQQSTREDEISILGLALDEAIAFKRVSQDLIRLLSTDCPDAGICAILDITPELLEKFKVKVKRKIKRVEINLGSSVEETGESQELSFWEFAQQTNGDMDLLAWPSYYACMDCVRKEANCTPHAVDKSFHKSRESHASGRGIFFQRPDLIRLLRLNFKRKYRPDVVRFVTDNKIDVFKISVKETDRTTLLPPNRVKGERFEIRAIRFIFVSVQDTLFSCVTDARRLASRIAAANVNSVLEISNEKVMMPPYE